MLLKPHLLPHPKPARLPQRKAVTIGVGYHCKDGVVIAADQQHTVKGYYKFHARKLGNLVYGGSLIAWTYSGYPNLNTIMETGLRDKIPPFPPELTPKQISDAISAQIAEMKTQYTDQMVHEQEFLFAFSCGHGTRFIRVSGGMIDEPAWAYIGVGDSSLVNYIGQKFRFVPPPLMGIAEAFALATFMVYLAKQFVDGVGGPTDVVILQNGNIKFYPARYMQELESKFAEMSDGFRNLYNILTNQAITDDDVERLLGELSVWVRWIRKNYGSP
jgi:hypothetical protein